MVTFLQPANMRTSQEYISEYFCVRNSHTSACPRFPPVRRGGVELAHGGGHLANLEPQAVKCAGRLFAMSPVYLDDIPRAPSESCSLPSGSFSD